VKENGIMMKRLKAFCSELINRSGGQRGAGLVEVLVALFITGTAVVIFISSLYSGSKTVGIIYERTTAENLARSQLEYVKGQEYAAAPTTYAILPSIPSEFSISAEASAIEERDENVQKITVTVSRNGETMMVLEDFKVNR
jgi:hypothetical protein